MNVKDKIKEYLSYKGVSPTSVERRLGWGVNAFTKAKSITVDRAKELILLFDDLSLEWLFRDEGPMIKAENEKGNEEISLDDENFFKRIIDEQLDTISMLKNRVAELEEKLKEESESVAS
jgi:hypothetical protein